jgi:hypothetical protein
MGRVRSPGQTGKVGSAKSGPQAVCIALTGLCLCHVTLAVWFSGLFEPWPAPAGGKGVTELTVKSIGGRLAALRTGLAATGSRRAGDLAGDPDRVAPVAGIHPLVFISFLACLAVMMAAFVALFWGRAKPVFMVAISTGVLLVYAGLPVLMLRFEMRGGPVLGAFLRQPLPTWSGLLTGRDAWIQVCLIPSMLALAAIALCLVVLLIRP